jgi:hypothetical protein
MLTREAVEKSAKQLTSKAIKATPQQAVKGSSGSLLKCIIFVVLTIWILFVAYEVAKGDYSYATMEFTSDFPSCLPLYRITSSLTLTGTLAKGKID